MILDRVHGHTIEHAKSLSLVVDLGLKIRLGNKLPKLEPTFHGKRGPKFENPTFQGRAIRP